MIEVIGWVLLVKGSNIFLLKNESGLGYEWALVGGHVKVDESIRGALKREVYEEVGVLVKEEDMSLQHIIDRRLIGLHKIHFFFLTEIWEGDPYNKEKDIHLDGKWYPLNNLPLDLGPLASSAIQSINKKTIYQEYGW